MTNHTTSMENFQTKHVSIFPNGIAFFHKSGELDTSSGHVTLEELPIGISSQGKSYIQSEKGIIFGSLRFHSPMNPLHRITVFSEEEETQVVSKTLIEILSQNMDKTIQFTLKGDSSNYIGKIVSLNDGVLLIKMDNGWKQISLEAIDYLDFTDTPTLFQKHLIQKTKIQLDFEHSQKSVSIDMVYFQKGMSWVPNYHMELLGDHKARLSLKVNVFNEVEDLKDATVNFILSIPSFSDIEEPLFSTESMERFLSNIERNPRYKPSSYDNAPISRARGGRNFRTRDEDAENDANTVGGLNDEDQFFYTAENISLPKNGRMLIQLLETEIIYKDRYSTRLKKGSHENYRRGKSTNKVWHSLEFKNDSGFPLPTGSIAFVKHEGGEMSPISQSRLDFVPAGLLAGVKMIQVPDIAVFDFEKVKNSEQLTDEKEGTQGKWKLFTIEATIKASNFKKKEITLEIEREISGELLSSDFPWTKNTLESEVQQTKNQSNEVSWILTLKPGESKKITYSYMMYVPW